VERLGINVNDFRVTDNDGAQPVDLPVVPGGPAAYFATIPVRAVVAALHAAGIPASISNSAGAHLCNHTLYLLGHLATTEYPGMRCGFVHLPGLPEQAVRRPGHPSMSAATAAAALGIAVTVAAAALRPDPAGRHRTPATPAAG
jgi:pyroglutamyl-peptidase